MKCASQTLSRLSGVRKEHHSEYPDMSKTGGYTPRRLLETPRTSPEYWTDFKLEELENNHLKPPSKATGEQSDESVLSLCLRYLYQQRPRQDS